MLLTGCSPLASKTQQFHIIQINGVIDHITGESVRTNTIWVTFEREGDDKVRFTYSNTRHFKMEIPIGAEVYVLVEEPGDMDWEMIVESKSGEYAEVVVELIPKKQNKCIS